MLFGLSVNELILLIPALVFSLCVHEFAHGYIAYRLGDNTAAYAGRLTLNPIAHLDPMGSLMLLVMGFGYAKPVPVNPINLRNPRIDMMKIAFAGPASNLILCFLGCLILRTVFPEAVIIKCFEGGGGVAGYNSSYFHALVIFSRINMFLAVFNMIPIHPLDGGQIFSSVLSKRNPNLAWKIQSYGPQVLLAIILISIVAPQQYSIIGMIMTPFESIVYLISGMPIISMACM